MESLAALGWSAWWAEAFAPFAADALVPARVSREHRGFYRLLAEVGEVVAEPAGRLRHDAASRADLPAVGDWVAMRPAPHAGRAVVHGVVPRRSAFVRHLAGEHTRVQIVASNVDTVFLVSGLDRDFNPRRIERYLVMAWESGARPVILLNKPDLRPDVAACVRELEAVAAGVPIHVVSGREPGGLEPLAPYLRPAETLAFLGSSGVGKSTLINRLLGSDVLPTRSVRESDQRGRHTTTQRQLLLLPAGALVIDTPGMRELQLWDAGSGIESTFDDIAALAAGCRFRDCRHEGEPGCAVQAAAQAGRLPADRLASFHKLNKELEHLARQQDVRLQAEQRRKWRNIHRAARKHSPRG